MSCHYLKNRTARLCSDTERFPQCYVINNSQSTLLFMLVSQQEKNVSTGVGISSKRQKPHSNEHKPGGHVISSCNWPVQGRLNLRCYETQTLPGLPTLTHASHGTRVCEGGSPLVCPFHLTLGAALIPPHCGWASFPASSMPSQ